MNKAHQVLFLFLGGRLVIETTSLNDLAIHVKLGLGASKHNLLNTPLSDKAKDSYILLLADTMCTILRLEISVRIPITVVAMIETLFNIETS